MYISKYCYSVLFLFVIYDYLYFATDILRESIAISFVLVALVHYYKKNWGMMFVFSLIAFGFHVFSLFFILILLVLSLKITVKQMTFVILLFAFMLISQQDITTYLAIVLLPITDISHYADYNLEMISVIGYLYKICMPMMVVYVLWRYRDTPIFKCSESNSELVKIILVFLCVVGIRWYVPYAERLFNYFFLICYVILVEGLYRLFLVKGTAQLKFLTMILIVAICSIPFVKLQFDETFPGVHAYIKYYPYNSIFEKETIKERDLFMKYDRDY